MKKNSKSIQKRSSITRRVSMTVLLLLLLILLLYVGWRVFFHQPNQQISRSAKHVDTSSSAVDTIVSDSLTDSSKTSTDTLKDTIETEHSDKFKPESPSNEKTKAPKLKPPQPSTVPDTADTTDSTDTVDSLSSTENPCARDTTTPWIYPEPAGGLHRQVVDVSFVSDEKADIRWRLGESDRWRKYNGRPIRIDSSRTLFYWASDTCGNEMTVRSEYYEIQISDVNGFCPSDMEYIEIGETRFCIDRYEWPNRKGSLPQALISFYHAQDSCFTAGKRLCSSEEWSMACAGAYGWRYPYGKEYEPRACNTTRNAVQNSGSNPECRGYFNVYDMAGNLAEWTDTRAGENNNFYNVMGGFWDSGSRSACFDSRYSYFPQNSHNPVGFRCCKDAAQ